MKNLEIWKDIEGYEGLYQVSSQGRVKSFWFGKERILKQAKDGCGYLQVNLCKDGKMKKFLVHRLVASAFIPNPLNLLQVNHKDENKENNAVENLEWCDRKYNINYGTRTERISKKVKQFSLEGEFIREWASAREIERQLDFFHTNISSCCKGKLPHAYGYIWRYAE